MRNYCKIGSAPKLNEDFIHIHSSLSLCPHFLHRTPSSLIPTLRATKIASAESDARRPEMPATPDSLEFTQKFASQDHPKRKGALPSTTRNTACHVAYTHKPDCLSKTIMRTQKIILIQKGYTKIQHKLPTLLNLCREHLARLSLCLSHLSAPRCLLLFLWKNLTFCRHGWTPTGHLSHV